MGKIGLGLAAAVLAFTSAAVVTAPAAFAAPSSTAVTLRPLSDPPGRCYSEEEGDVKLDSDTEVLFQCDYISGEGFYWIALW